MFTKANMNGKAIQLAIGNIPAMGGKIVEYPSQCTVLVSKDISRTSKVLSAINRAVPIVSPAWMVTSHKEMRFVDTEPFRLKDAKNEKRLYFNLEVALGQ